MADTTVSSDVAASSNRAVWGPFWTSTLIGAIFAADGNFDVVAWKTTDGGANWTKSAAAVAGSVTLLACWFDQQEVGSSGGLVHTVWLDDPGAGSSETFKYANYTIATNAWSTPVNVATGLTTNTTISSCFIVGTKASGLVCGYANGVNSGALKSTDGASWSATTDPFEANTGDYALGAWVDTDDDNDAGILFWDLSADEISVKMYDDSGDTWTETSISGSMVENTTYRQSSWAAQTRASDGHVILVAWNGIDLVTADLKCWDLTLDSIASPTITAKTEINTNLAESGGAGIYIDPSTGHLYAVYAKGGTWASTTTIQYKKSTDGATTWGSETAYSEAAAANNQIISGGYGVNFQPCWLEIANSDIFVNLVNGVAGGGAAGSGSLLLLGVG